ncbi:hypothetical protein GCM10010124_10540 [Pilimelia terevasa]|uniref:Peptidase C51 domain-containing protein n=1 Tax=Pilimelia terevasa TaxID=53372 RepID=A0A8J3FIM8_9ACTN|nr:FG-GAP-like repeat-containing protein [Pilimelia terevasa]GGK19828.1 hypothetical protein GCM10010124_10540 [Pilimelia terevasa]
MRRARIWCGWLTAAALLVTGLPASAAPPPAPPAGTGSAAIVALARAEVGRAASGRKCQPYGPMCTDWCAMFATWVWEQAGVPGVPRGQYVATALGVWGQQRGLYSARPPGTRGGGPLPGDLAVYGVPGHDLGGHVAVVSAVHPDGTLSTVDGNYGNRVVERRLDPLTARAGADDVPISGYVRAPGGAPPARPAAVAPAVPPGPPAAPGNAPALAAVDGDGRLFGYSPAAGSRATAGPKARPARWHDTARDWSATTALTRADVDRDGRPDLIAVRTDGTLAVHQHAGAATPAATPPYGEATWSTPGQWGFLRLLAAGDLTGDGYADLVGVDAAGGLVGFVNTRDPRQPFTGQPAWRIADWVGTRQLVATDLDGDRLADLVVAGTDGSLQGFVRRPGPVPFGTPAWRSTDPRWAAHRQLAATDADGDRYGDLMGVAPDGDLVVYRHGRAGAPYGAEAWRVRGPWLTTRALT